MATVGFIGLGQIGRPMAQRIVENGYDVVLFDVRAECLESFSKQGVRVVCSAAEVGDCADVVLVSLPDPAAVAEVALGQNGLASGRRVKTYVDLSTTGPIVAREVAATLAQHGIDTLDAPVSGGVSGACSGNLTIMTAGARHVFEQAKPIIESFGRNVFYVGAEVGLGQAMKLANNLLAAGALALTAEAMAIGVREGLDPRTMIDVFNAGSGMNTATRDKFPKDVLTGSHYTGALTLLWKNAGDGTFSPVQFDAIEPYSYHFATAPGTTGKARTPAFADAYSMQANVPETLRASGLSLYTFENGKWTKRRAWRQKEWKSYLFGLAFGDLDKDGLDDLLFVDNTVLKVRVLFQKPDGTFVEAAEAEEPTLDSPGQTLRLADVNGDGKPDILVSKTVAVSDPTKHGGWDVYLNRR